MNLKGNAIESAHGDTGEDKIIVNLSINHKISKINNKVETNMFRVIFEWGKFDYLGFNIID